MQVMEVIKQRNRKFGQGSKYLFRLLICIVPLRSSAEREYLNVLTKHRFTHTTHASAHPPHTYILLTA